MTAQQTLAEVEAACAAGDLGAILSLLRPMAALDKAALAKCKGLIRRRFGARFRPSLLNEVLRNERSAFFESQRESQRAKDFAILSASSSRSISRPKNPHAVALGRRGGLRRARKGLAAISPDRANAIRRLAVEALQRKRTQQAPR